MKLVSLAPAPPAAAAEVKARRLDRQIAEKAREFEAVMLGQFVRSMTEGLATDGPTGGGSAEGQWRDVLAQEYGKAIAEAGGIGIAVQVERAMRAGLVPEGSAPEQAGEPEPAGAREDS